MKTIQNIQKEVKHNKTATLTEKIINGRKVMTIISDKGTFIKTGWGEWIKQNG